MDVLLAKELVIRAGKELVKNGLIARTWGNVSCRISDKQFVITPSGKAYQSLTVDDIVIVNIEDGSYQGDVKPSSEKGIHATVYALKPDANFVIHTHQVYASAVSVLGLDINNVEGESKAIIGDHVPCASYGLPGTGKLKKGVKSALIRSDAKAILMQHHGALCMGSDYAETFKVALELEKVCEAYILNKYNVLVSGVADGFRSIGEYVYKLQNSPAKMPEFPAFDSERIGSSMRLLPKDGGEEILLDIFPQKASEANPYEPVVAELHRAVYKKRKDANCIIHSNTDAIKGLSKLGITIKPLLDDLAQIVGPNVKNAKFDPTNTLKSSKKVVRKLRFRNAVLLNNNGAICLASNEEDVEAVEMVLEKGAKSHLTAAMFEKFKPINAIESRLMRFVYMQKYSKQK